MRSWFPWQFIVRMAARRRGFVDPVDLLARLRRLGQPSEVQEPIELVRAGVVFHARGLINTKVFQYNLDWVWPYWVVRQFDPGDASFLPRAFSFSHVNLTHRNWTALGQPGEDAYAVVDPRGLVTMPEDPWSLDWWFVPERGSPIFPSRRPHARQWLSFERGLAVVTRCEDGATALETEAWSDGRGKLALEARVNTPGPGVLVLSLRPVNPEGVHFIEQVALEAEGWRVNSAHRVRFARAPSGYAASNYAAGDVAANLQALRQPGETIRCPAGMVTAGALFPVGAGGSLTVRAEVELHLPGRAARSATGPATWPDALEGTPEVDVPDEHWRFLHEAALRTIILLSPGDVYPGPWTYRRFWFRDACLLLHALLAVNRESVAEAALERFAGRQRHDGFFHSQEGEWDSNGQVLWIANRFERLSNRLLSSRLTRALADGARWIDRKRRHNLPGDEPGLFPPGFSAEHLGPVSQYYWDDFWGIAGLRAAAELVARREGSGGSAPLLQQAAGFAGAVRASLDRLPAAVKERGIPASPHRRMDAGAIGSLVADYPLRLDDVVTREEVLRSADWLWHHCRFQGGIFQDMIHSGINVYLTLALAQTFMRHGDPRHRGLVDAAAALASPTGQWPEAVHPRTLGGCMGDGQHAWAAAEWLLALRSMFLREERDSIVVGAGLRPEWLETARRLAYGPTSTTWGPVSIEFLRRDLHRGWVLHVRGRWHGAAPRIWVAAPGFAEGWADLVGGAAPLEPAGQAGG